MRIQTFTIVAGSEACNARCPYCVARMTPAYDLTAKLPPVNWRNFRIACGLARSTGVTTVLITGKGEPTLFPDQITEFLRAMQRYEFPFVEIQTNGIALAQGKPATRDHLALWYELGMTTIALSLVHWEPKRNQPVYLPQGPDYFDLGLWIDRMHKCGFSVRLSVIMLRGWIDTPEEVESMAGFCRKHGVEQLTVRSVTRPQAAADPEVARFVDEHLLAADAIQDIRKRLDAKGKRLLELVHGAVVYDLDGQNLCLSNCLTIDPGDEQIRQLIFWPDGHLRYDWQYPGAILL